MLLVAPAFATNNPPPDNKPPVGSKANAGSRSLSSTSTLIDFGDSDYSADYAEAAQAVAVDGSECSGSFAVGTRQFQIGAAGPSPFCQKLASAREDRKTAQHLREMAASMTCTAPHEINKSGEAWVPNSCLTEQHRMRKEAHGLELAANETLTNARRDANKKPGLLGKIWAVVGM